MVTLTLTHFLIVCPLVFLAGFVDAVAGGGGLISLPAYLISGLLFAFLHLWQFVLVHQDTAYFLVLLQYLVPGLVLAGVYEYSGTLWSSIAVHAAVNALAWLL